MGKKVLWRVVSSLIFGTLWVVRISSHVANVIVDALVDHIVSDATRRKIDLRVACVIGVALIALYLEPTMKAGLSKSDTFKAYMASYELATAGTAAATFDAFRRELPTNHSGLFPIADLPLRFWQSSPPVDYARTVQLIAVSVNALTFAWFLARASNSGALTLLALAITGVATQLRLQGDPILGPILAAPLAAEFGLLVLAGAVSFARSSNPWWFALTFGAAVAAALTDGMGYVTCVVGSVALLAWGFDLRKALCAFALIAIPIACIGITLRTGPTEVFANARPSLSATIGNLVAPIPTSYRATGHLVVEAIKPSNADTRFTKFDSPGFVGWFTIIAIAIVVLVTIACSRSCPSTGSRPALAACAAALWLLPACLSSARAPALAIGAPREELYIETFGISLLIALLIEAGARRVRDTAETFALATSVALLASIIVYGNVRTDAFILGRASETEGQRLALERAATAGLFNEIPANAAIILSGVAGLESGTASPRDGRFLLFALTKKHYATYTHASISPGGVLCRNRRDSHFCTPLRGDVYVVTATRQGQEAQIVTALHWAGSGATVLLTDSGSRFRTGAAPDADALGPDASSPSSGLLLAADSLGTVVHMRRICGPVVSAAAFSAAKPAVIWGAGFYAPYPAVPFIAATSLPARIKARNPWAYAGRSAHMTVTDVPCGGRRVRISAQVFTAQPANLRVRYAGIERNYETSQDGTNINFVISMPSSQVDITFETDALPAHNLYVGGRESDAVVHDYRMLVRSPAAAIEVGS